MSKKIDAAVKVLQDYLPQLDSVNNEKEGNNWKAKVLDSLNKYLGSDSELYKRLANEFFTQKVQRQTRSIPGVIDLNVYYDHVYKPERKQYFVNILNEVIQHIKNHGVKDDFIKTNFLSSFNTGQIWTGILGVGTIVFWVGWFVGGTQKDREIIKTEFQRDTAIISSTKLRENLILQQQNISQTTQALGALKLKYDSLASRRDTSNKIKK